MLNLHQTFRSILARARSTRPALRREPIDCPAPGLAAQLYWARRQRSVWFDSDLFWEPTFDLLLYLYDAWESGKDAILADRAVDASAAVSPESARRWIQLLESRGYVVLFEDECGCERIALTDRGREAMTGYLGNLKGAAPV